jgi:formate hydrogenlyase subunit 3/multisubunit Na+/H+ antiporter MnhD subunit
MKFARLGGLVGLAISYPVSYFFQPEAVQHKLTLGQYLSKFADVLQADELRSPIITSLLICTLGCTALGMVLDKQAAAKAAPGRGDGKDNSTPSDK